MLKFASTLLPGTILIIYNITLNFACQTKLIPVEFYFLFEPTINYWFFYQLRQEYGKTKGDVQNLMLKISRNYMDSNKKDRKIVAIFFLCIIFHCAFYLLLKQLNNYY